MIKIYDIVEQPVIYELNTIREKVCASPARAATGFRINPSSRIEKPSKYNWDFSWKFLNTTSKWYLIPPYKFFQSFIKFFTGASEYGYEATFMKICNFPREAELLGADFLIPTLDIYETAPETSSGAENKSPGICLHAASIWNGPASARIKKYEQILHF